MAGSVTLTPVRRLVCCCCGAATRGRQWWNRDTGYGLCVDCIPYCARNTTPEDFQQSYGTRGVHYDVQEGADAAPPIT